MVKTFGNTTRGLGYIVASCTTRGITPSEKMRELKVELMKRHMMNFRSMSLEGMHNYLFAQVCSGEQIDREVFTRKLQLRDNDYIDMLSRRLEAYIDKLSQHVIQNGTNIHCPSDSHKYCEDNSKCVPIPGYYERERMKYFSPQLYHILQDYGFFWYFLGVDTIKEQLPIRVLEDQYKVKIALELGKKLRGSVHDKLKILRDMEKRLLRIQFLRSFNVQCCIQKEQDRSHIRFGNILETILKLTRDEMKTSIS